MVVTYFFYNLAMCLYGLGVCIASLFSKKVRKMVRGERIATRYIKERWDEDAPYLWFHAASLGEFEQGRPMMEWIRQKYPQYKILLTFFSPSGYEVRKDYEGADIICYLPLDTPYRSLHFFSATKNIVAAFFIKYDFWWNYLHILKAHNVPTYSISSTFRPGQIFFRSYAKRYARVLKCFTHLYVQNERSRELLAGIGVTNVTVVGDTRFDRVLKIKEDAMSLPIVESFCEDESKKTIVVGSSWPGDENVIFPCPCKMIIAPHNVNEDRINNIISKCEGKSVIRYTQIDAQHDAEKLREADVLIIDCYGLLSSVYRYGDVTYVGGGFDHTGIHNVLEAAVWEKPVLYGPNYHEYQEGEELIASGGGIELSDADNFREVMKTLLNDKSLLADISAKAGAYVKSKTGATAQILNDIDNLLASSVDKRINK